MHDSGDGQYKMSYTMKQNGAPSYRHLHKPYWFVMGPFGYDYEGEEKEEQGSNLKQVSAHIK